MIAYWDGAAGDLSKLKKGTLRFLDNVRGKVDPNGTLGGAVSMGYANSGKAWRAPIREPETWHEPMIEELKSFVFYLVSLLRYLADVSSRAIVDEKHTGHQSINQSRLDKLKIPTIPTRQASPTPNSTISSGSRRCLPVSLLSSTRQSLLTLSSARFWSRVRFPHLASAEGMRRGEGSRFAIPNARVGKISSEKRAFLDMAVTRGTARSGER